MNVIEYDAKCEEITYKLSILMNKSKEEVEKEIKKRVGMLPVSYLDYLEYRLEKEMQK